MEPTATTRPPAACAALMASAAAGATSPLSGPMRWSSVSSTLTGKKVPAPMCSVNRTSRTPRPGSAAIRPRVKWSPAVGAATAPGLFANRVW